jgi:hypothetical protein
MGWCVNCGTKTRGRAHLCTQCNAREKNAIKLPKVPLTESERENVDMLRASYDTGYAIEKYFQDAYNSI